VVLEEKISMTTSNFWISVIISPFEDDLALYLYKLESLYPRMICTDFD
jgi:hypothetical protein